MVKYGAAGPIKAAVSENVKLGTIRNVTRLGRASMLSAEW